MQHLQGASTFKLLKHSTGIAGYEFPFRFWWRLGSKPSAGFKKGHELSPVA